MLGEMVLNIHGVKLHDLKKTKQVNLTGSIKDVEFCSTDHELFGWCNLKRNKFDISISLKRNNTIEEYAGTLLHELLHLWLGILQRHKYLPVGMKNEHKVIEMIEAVTQFALHQIYIQREKTKPKKPRKKRKK
jgi:hypothetical protein